MSDSNRKHWLDYLAVAVAAISILIGVVSILALRAHQRISVTPQLSFDGQFSSKSGSFEIYVRNGGLGPAKIVEAKLVAGDKELDLKVAHEAIVGSLRGDGLVIKQWTSFSKGELIGMGERILVSQFYIAGYDETLANSQQEADLAYRNAKAKLSKYAYKMIYTSVYEDGDLPASYKFESPLPSQAPADFRPN